MILVVSALVLLLWNVNARVHAAVTAEIDLRAAAVEADAAPH